jgi:hypothetical protein
MRGDMSVLETLKFVTFRPLRTNDAVAIRRRKLIAKIDEQIQFSSGKIDAVKGFKTVTDAQGSKKKVEVSKRVKPWWGASVDGKVHLTVRYGSKPLEFGNGLNAIELSSEEEVPDVLRRVREAVESGQLDDIIAQKAKYRVRAQV